MSNETTKTERDQTVKLDVSARVYPTKDPKHEKGSKQTRDKVTEGRIIEDNVLDGIDPTHDHLAAARDAAIEAAGLDGIEVAQAGLTSLKNFPMSDIYRRSIREPDTLPKNDLRFINSGYDEQFRIPDGGTIQVEYPDRTFSVRCEYIDDYHAYIGSEIYHMRQFAEILERGGGVCRPEPVLDAEQAAWKIGWNAYLAVECGAGYWDYKLLDEKFNETRSGNLEVVGCSINEVRDMILAENKLGSRSMTPTDYGLLMEKAAQMGQERIGQDGDEHDVVELFGTTALFFNERVPRENVPEGLYRYDLRGSDDDPGDPVSVEHHVGVNHAGTILTAKPLEIPAQGYLLLGDELNFIAMMEKIFIFLAYHIKNYFTTCRINFPPLFYACKTALRLDLLQGPDSRHVVLIFCFLTAHTQVVIGDLKIAAVLR